MKPLILLAFLGAICALVALKNTSASDKPDPTQVKTMDDLFAEVGAKVPGFAGFFYDEEGIATTSMVDGEIGLDTPDGERAKRALNEVFGENYVDGSDVRVVSAKYSFVQLKSWYDRFWTKVLAMPGVVSTDIDEVHNRLRIGIESWDAEKAPSSLIQEAGVPSDVAQFFLDELAGQDQCIQAPRSLTDPVCPRRGGLKILAYGSGKQCTLGFVVKRSNVTGFVTNSHCTDVQGGVDGTLFYQPAKPTTNPSLDYLGQESVDPTYFTGAPCPSGRSCRFSDSAFTPFAPGLWYNWGAVWRTQSVGDHVPGSIVIDETNATFRVTSATSWPASGWSSM